MRLLRQENEGMEAEYYERPRGCKGMVEVESRCEDILDSWVSGRRTMHEWIMDERTMELTETRTERSEERKSAS
jgi:hypothetical protein